VRDAKSRTGNISSRRILDCKIKVPTKKCSYYVLTQIGYMNHDVIYEQRERVFHRDIQTRENNV
jgi:hypothetical protein